MSNTRQHTNGDMNGPNPQFRRWDLDTSSRETSDAERSRSRPGQDRYGRPPQLPAQVHGVARLDRGNAHRRSREYDSRSRSRPGARYGGAGMNSQVEG